MPNSTDIAEIALIFWLECMNPLICTLFYGCDQNSSYEFLKEDAFNPFFLQHKWRKEVAKISHARKHIFYLRTVFEDLGVSLKNPTSLH